MCRSAFSSDDEMVVRTDAASSGPATRNARAQARRSVAVSTQSRVACTHAPRPGNRAWASTTTDPSSATTLTSEDRGARWRQPRQVLTGSMLPLLHSARRPSLETRCVSSVGAKIDIQFPSLRTRCVLRSAQRSRFSPRVSRPSLNRAEYRSLRQSASRRGGRFDPLCRSRARVGSRERGHELPWSPGQ